MRPRRLVLQFAVAAMLIIVGACSSGLVIAAARYSGPPVRIEQGSRTHIATFTAPTGGWSARLDHVRRRFQLQEAFMTLVRPPADALVSQAEVQHHVETRVSIEDDITIYARIIEHGVDGRERPYLMAGQASGLRASEIVSR